MTVARVCATLTSSPCTTCPRVQTWYKGVAYNKPITFKEGSVECGEPWRTPQAPRTRARERLRTSRLVSSPLVSLRLPRGSSPHECQQASRAPQHAARLTHHMPASPGIISLLTYTKAVMPSLPVVLKRILGTLHTDDKRTFDAHDAGAYGYAPASLRKRGARAAPRRWAWSSGGAPRRDPQAGPTHRYRSYAGAACRILQ